MRNVVSTVSCMVAVWLLTLGLNAQPSPVWSGQDPYPHHHPCRVFIGVDLSSDESGNLRIDRVVENSPAAKSALLVGDRVLAIDGQRVYALAELLSARDKHQPGDSFNLTILRDGKESTVEAAFLPCNPETMGTIRPRHEPNWLAPRHIDGPVHNLIEQHLANQGMAKVTWLERPILGIYPGEATAEGIRIDGIIGGKGAQEAGLLEGDVLTSIDGKAIGANRGIADVLAGYSAGDQVLVSYLRQGTPLQSLVTLSPDRNYHLPTPQRDPCAIFIGVYATEGDKLVVTGVIEGTPAQAAGVLPGDRIVAIDGVSVLSFEELRAQRDKHKPGDVFSLDVIREGQALRIDARFKSCQQATAPTPPAPQELPVTPAPPSSGNLTLKAFNAFPNPSSGLINVRFEAEAKPTTVRVQDAQGKVVYDRVLNNFDGIFNEALNLSGNTPGTYFIVVLQGEQTLSSQILLLPSF